MDRARLIGHHESNSGSIHEPVDAQIGKRDAQVMFRIDNVSREVYDITEHPTTYEYLTYVM